MGMRGMATWFATVVGIVWALPAWGGIIATTGDVVVLSPPASVAVGQLESNTQISVFEEQSGVVLGTDLVVDVREPGSYGPGANLGSFPRDGSIPSGTSVASYYFHADHVGTSGTTTFSGTVTFDSDVLGLAFTGDRLSSTSSVLGYSGTAYDSSGTGVQASDHVILSSDRRTVTFSASQGGGADNLRVITVAPEPTTFTLLSLVGFGLIHRRRPRH